MLPQTVKPAKIEKTVLWTSFNCSLKFEPYIMVMSGLWFPTTIYRDSGNTLLLSRTVIPE